MEFYELLVGLNLKKEITMKDMPKEMSKAINILFLAKDELKEFHKKNHVKLYNYSGLAPVEEDKVYKKGKEYIFKIRFINKQMATYFEDLFYDIENPLFTTLRVELVPKNIVGTINKLYTLNPAVITVNNKCWIRNDAELDLVKERILRNTNKKYNFLNNTRKPVHDFIEYIKILNDITMSYNYKSGFILGNKFRIGIKKDELSQELAKLILGAGLLEKNSLSFGFCLENDEELI